MQRRGPKPVKLFDFRTTNSIRLIALLGDSWLSKDRVRASLADTIPRDHIDIFPHGTTSSSWKYDEKEKVFVTQAAFIENYSKGGYTFDAFLKDEERLDKWAREVPELSILHVGACELANTNKYTKEKVKTQFTSNLAQFLKEWQTEAKKKLKTSKQKALFDRRLKTHKWLIVNVPVWDQSTGILHMTPEDFRICRKRINTALKNSRTRLWEEFNAVILCMELQYPQFFPGKVHLKPDSQLDFNTQVFDAASKVICEFCTWTLRKFVPAEHNLLLRKSHMCGMSKLAPHRIVI